MTGMSTHTKAVFLFARKLGASWEDAEDIAQDVMLKAFTHGHQFSSAVGAYRAWLYTIARNLYFSRYRQKSMQLRLAHKAIQEDISESKCEETCELELLSDKMTTLPIAQSSALCDLLSGMKYEEIAEARGVPVGTIKSRIARAREALCT